jgi:hypothetical protein
MELGNILVIVTLSVIRLKVSVDLCLELMIVRKGNLEPSAPDDHYFIMDDDGPDALLPPLDRSVNGLDPLHVQLLVGGARLETARVADQDAVGDEVIPGVFGGGDGDMIDGGEDDSITGVVNDDSVSSDAYDDSVARGEDVGIEAEISAADEDDVNVSAADDFCDC